MFDVFPCMICNHICTWEQHYLLMAYEDSVSCFAVLHYGCALLLLLTMDVYESAD